MPDTGPGLLNTSRVERGALVVYETQQQNAASKTILFQYNPDQMTRKLEIRAPQAESGKAGGAREDVLRVQGPPVEVITMSVALDAADQLENPDKNQSVVEHGLNPFLATLEMLLYPPTLRVQQNQQLAAGGEVQVTEADLPLVLLNWGQTRVVPVQITNFSIAEEAYDSKLNPIRAKVDFTFKVLTYMELQPDTQGYDAFVAYQRQKEELAAKHPTAGSAPTNETA